MRELAARLSALAPEAANALQVIAYFDKLIEHGAGARSVVRGAAVLSGCPAGLLDRAHDIRLRTLPDGTTAPPPRQADRSWPRAGSRDGTLEIWLERENPAHDSLDALVLERALLAVTTSLGQAPDTPGYSESICVRLLLAADPGSATWEGALRGLRLTAATPICIVATLGGAPIIARSAGEGQLKAHGQRAGIGPVGPAREAPRSWKDACLALRLTAEGTPQDPGDRVILAEEAGALLAIAGKAGPGDIPPPDVTALETAAANTPWMLQTLHAISTTDSVRDAAALLHLHHSTVQERAARAERVLGWAVLSQRGKQRVQLALVMRRIFSAIHSEPVGSGGSPA
jgi:hypothetical protein